MVFECQCIVACHVFNIQPARHRSSVKYFKCEVVDATFCYRQPFERTTYGHQSLKHFFFSDKLAWAYWTFQSSLNISVKYGSLLIFSWRKHKTPIYLYKDLFLSVLSRYALNSLSILTRHAIISYPFGHSLCCSSRTNMWGFPLLQSTRRAQLDITAEIVRDNELKRPLATPLARA